MRANTPCSDKPDIRLEDLIIPPTALASTHPRWPDSPLARQRLTNHLRFQTYDLSVRVLPVILSFIDRVNAAHPWSHNDAYTGFVMRHARVVRRIGGTVAVDVGCGTGDLLERLATVFPDVLGVESDVETARIAARRFSHTAAQIEARPFGREPADSYDLIVFVASLHHMPLRSALEQARAAVRPGGRIVIVGLAREDSQDALRTGLSVVLNPLVGLIRHPTRAAGVPARMQAPTAAPAETFAEIRDVASTVLPGVKMRRRLFWRYTAHWSAPR